MEGNILAEKTKVYGYGQQYKQTAVDMLKELYPYLNDLTYYNVDDGVLFIDHHY